MGLAKSRILIIDDNENNQKVLSRHLESEDYQAVKVGSAKEGLTLVEKEKFDLILLDYMMPEMNGIDFLKEFRKTHSGISYPVIMVTAKDEEESVLEALAAGANDYITKPINFDIALMRVKMFLDWREANQELAEAKLLSEKSNQAKSQFLTNMSHEIRTPLNGIIGMVDILMRSELTEKQREQLDTVSQSGEHLLSVINDILEFSKIESGMLTIESVEFNLINCIESVCDVMAQSVFRKKLDFLVYIDKSVPQKVIGDEARLRQLIVNLLGNAVKYTPTGQISVSVTQQPLEQQEKCEVIIDIKDTGVGIPKEKINSIFEAFRQTDESDTRKYGGTGLGLTISKEIVEAMSGSITVESEEAKGSTFRLRIPFEVSNKLTDGEDVELGQFQHPVIIALRNSHFRKNIVRYLEGCGGDLRESKDYKDSIELIRQLPGDKPGVLLIEKDMIGEELSNFFDSLWQDDLLKKWFFVLLIDPNDEFLLNNLSDSMPVMSLSNPPKRDILLKVISSKQKIQRQTKSRNYQIKSGSSYKILLVEDNKTNQQVATLMIRAAGHTLEVANNGKEALDKITADEKFDLILMDCQMPVMDGYEATRKIRKWEQQENKVKIPIIAMTANAFKQTKEECFECGMDGFVTKPVTLNELVEALDSTLDRLKKVVVA